MKVDTSRLKKGTSEVPPECQTLIDKLKSCNRSELIDELSVIETWTFGKCELYHWIDILDIFDEILEEATHYVENQIYIACDTLFSEKDRKLLLLVLNFTTLLIEHSFSRHLYNSVEHLTQLLLSTDLEIILGVLNLLYMFSKRSNFISRLSCHKKNTLLSRLKHIAEPYGGKECGFGLADCCKPDKMMPKAIYHFYYEYYTKNGTLEVIDYQNISRRDPKMITVKFWKDLDQQLDDDQKYHLFARARLATGFWNYDDRILFVQARLQALSILVYSDALLGYTSTLIYPGFLEELVELLELQKPNLVEIRAAALRTLTAIIHLERNSQYQRKSESRLNTIIEVTGASSYHGFLPTLVRNCIANLTGLPSTNNKTLDQLTTDENMFPLQLATALFSFLYHLASYEAGAESLVSCGMMESLLRVINWSGTELEHITFVTRAVRVIDLITNLDMQSFQLNNGLCTFIKRLNLEVNLCRKEQSYEIRPNLDEASQANQASLMMDENMETSSQYDDEDVIMSSSTTSITGSGIPKSNDPTPSNKTCLPQRAALLKSMLNFLKKAIQDSAFADSIRHIMEGTLPESLKHIISNAEYYGPSLFLLATDVVTVYVFQEPSLLSSLQDNGLTDVVLQALLKKDVPATREVLGSLPNVFSALCLNTRGLESFVKYNPFEKLFQVLISPVYLSAMRRRRSSDPMGDTASNIGNAMDELMRNQPTLKSPAIKAIIKLLDEIVELGTDPKYICWRAQSKNDISPTVHNSRANNNNNVNDNGGSSDEDEEDEEEVSSSSHNQARDSAAAAAANSGQTTTANSSQVVSANERIPIALIDYTLNTMKFLEAILSNNSTDDHCREFVTLGGLRALLSILSLPNFPVTSCNSPITATAQAVASVCKSILNLTHEPSVLQVALEQLSGVVEQLKPLQNNLEHTSSSVLLKELANCPDLNQAFTNATFTPLLHAMSAVHGYVVMLVHVCRTGQSDIRTLSLMKWGQDNDYGMKLLKKLVMLYTALVWESTLLLALCTDDIIPPGSEFGKDEMDKLQPSDLKHIADVNWDEIVSNLSVMENLTTNSATPSTSSPVASTSNMDVDNQNSKTKTESTVAVRFGASPSQLKYIKSLLGASSRLGRALAELFGLLVKLCVGSPLRQRRGQNFPPAPTFTSPASREIARILSFILVDGLSFTKLPAAPVPKLKLTFLICSIGFTSPMLFDEKRYAYHLMLQKFIEEGGLEAFFEMFRWTLTSGYTIPIHRAIEHPNLPDGTGEALDAWLMLLEKMVNIRSIIESPHLITSKNSRVKQEFDAKHYLTYMHRHAFTSIQHLWGFKPLKTYGLRMTESMLSILKHIVKGEKVLQSKYYKNGNVTISLDAKYKTIVPSIPQDEPSAVQSLPSTSRTNPPVAEAPVVNVNSEHLRQLMDMGFSRVHCEEALNHCISLEQATDYLLNNPIPTQLDRVSYTEEFDPPAMYSTSTPTPSTTAAAMEIDFVEEDDQVIRAILMSLGGETSNAGPIPRPNEATETPETTESNVTLTDSKEKSTSTSPTQLDKNKQEVKSKHKEILKKYSQEQPLLKKVLDEFTDNLLTTCLTILDQLPETVYKICDLLITITKRNGPVWRDAMLDTLCSEISQCIQHLIVLLMEDNSKHSKEKSEKLVSGEMANKTAVRIHLFTLFFEGQYQEMKVPCASVLRNYNIIPRLIKVLTDYQMFASMLNRVLPTPKWLAPLALLLDLYDKVALSTSQKQQMHKISTKIWQWYDIGTAKWNIYTPPQNKLINEAYRSGETEIRLNIGRNRYTINFNCMSQINDESANHRPIICALKAIEELNNPEESDENKTDENKSEEKAESTDDSKTEESESVTTLTNTETVKPISPDDPAAETSSEMDVDSPAKKYSKLLSEIELDPLASFAPEEIVSSCVQLMSHQQLDRDTLHAIMRVVVRLTKDYHLAEVFARYGGIDVLLSMKHSSGYIGFTTLATLLIRHVLEEPKTLSLAIQNVIINRTLSTIPAGHRELLFLIRQLSSAVYRNPVMFKEAALKVLKVDFDSMKRSNITDDRKFIMKATPLSHNTVKFNMEQSTAMGAVCKLLKILVEPEENVGYDPVSSINPKTDNAPKEKSSSKHSQTADSNTEAIDAAAKEKQAINDKLLLTKSAILKILAESVRSYQTVALYITEHVYRAGLTPLITEDTTALSFILDKLFHINDVTVDRECPSMAQSLISAIASSDVVQAQYTVVHEVKCALQRALNETETNEKHFHIEGLATLIPAMIENNMVNIESNQFFKINNQPQFRQNIFYIMLEKGIITDLARAVQYLELGGPNTTTTINHLLKPLEILLRLTNEPMPSFPAKFKKAPPRRVLNSNEDAVEETTDEQPMQSQAFSEALSNNVNATVTTTNSGVTANPNAVAQSQTASDSTNAQDEQMLADDSEQNTERDMSSAAIDSMAGENPIAEAHLNDILDTLINEELRHDPNDYEDDPNGDDDDEDQNEEDNRLHRRNHLRENVESLLARDNLVESSSDSGDSDSGASENDEREMMDEVDENEEDDEEEEAEERSELDVDEETQPFIEMFDRHLYGRHLSPSIPEIERDNEDILMIQYSNNSQNNSNSNNNANNEVSRADRNREATLSGNNISITVSNSASNTNNPGEQPPNFLFNSNFPLLYNDIGEGGGNENSNSAQGASSNISNEPSTSTINTNAPPNNHPLLSGRPDGAPPVQDSHRHHDHAPGGSAGGATMRSTNRPRRYQFINISSRNQPVILQRLLGPNANQATINAQAAHATAGGANGPFSFRDATRVVVMDNGFNIFANDDMEIEMVDQSGYWFGRTLANHLNNHPSALCWWQEENKISGPDSNSDLCMGVCNEMIPDLDAARASELSKLRGKRKKKAEEEEQTKPKNQDLETTQELESPEEAAQNLIYLPPRTAASDVASSTTASQTTSNLISAARRANAAIRNIAINQSITINQLRQDQDRNRADLEDMEMELARLISNRTSLQSRDRETEENGNAEGNMSIAFMEVNEDEAGNARTSTETVNALQVPPPQQLSAENHLNVDVDIEMASDVDESSASANNSRSFSPNYSPNNQQEISNGQIIVPTTPEVVNPNAQNSAVRRSQEDHHMRGDTDVDSDDEDLIIENAIAPNALTEQPPAASGELETVQARSARNVEELTEALQVPLPSDDDESDSDIDSELDEEGVKEPTEEEGAVGGSENVDINQAESASTSQVILDPAVRNILGDLEVPEGIDPSFLAALPSEMRQEVIAEHNRQQRIRQRALQSAAQQETQAVTEVNPEFLAALPPNLQEEVLAHQRIEQQRQAAAAANPNDPVNAAEFFQNLQPSLRQAILTDMEDSQISALPPDLAAEAQNLRRDWESRNRQMLQERLLTSSFSSVFRYNNRNRLADPRVYVPRHNFLGFNSTGGIALTRSQVSHTTITANMERQGSPLLDQESLASILVLLFMDDPNLSTLRLYRVIRNLCFHIPTRKWIIKSLLSIIYRCNEESMEQYLEPSSSRNKGARDANEDKVKWLKLRLDSALGGRANVFLKKTDKQVNDANIPLTIHPKASPTVCRHTLDLLIFLAKSFPSHFLPNKKNTAAPAVLAIEPTPSTSDEPMPSTSSQAVANVSERSADFWDILLRLDNEIDDRIKDQKLNSTLKEACKQIRDFTEPDIKLFNESPFGQLVMMLAYDIIRKNSLLTDKLLRLLSLISIVLANVDKPTARTAAAQQVLNSLHAVHVQNIANTDESKKKLAMSSVAEEDVAQKLPESEGHLALAVQVLTSKSCSEDGLEDATALLINLSQCSSKTKFMIINLLVDGVISLSHAVQQHINTLMKELKELNDSLKVDKGASTSSGPADDDHNDHPQRPNKGRLQDRFTKEAVVITAPNKVKTSCDLQLPSMAPLLSKISNQSFFLRILKVITQIRDTVRQDAKSCDADIEQKLQKLETVPLSELLNLDSLWSTLSDCLKELEETQDHHAVLVLQPAVEAFFIVHSAPQVKTPPAPASTANPRRGAAVAPRSSNSAPPSALANIADEHRDSSISVDPVHISSSAMPVVAPSDTQEEGTAELNSRSRAEEESAEALSPMDTTLQEQNEAGAPQQQLNEMQIADDAQPGPSSATVPPPAPLSADQKKFLQFAETHRVVLNQILRQSSTHLADGPFAVLADHTRVLDFDVKRRYFRIELERLDDGIRREELAVHVHRVNVFEDSFRELYRRNPEEWKNRFYIVFEDEEGQDAGGLLREWYMIISREIFNAMYALFCVSPGDRVTYMINPSSHCNPNHLCYFKFVGRVIAKAIYDNKLLECYFTRSFYKHILGIQVKYTDMESEDYAFYQGLVYLMENKVDTLGYDLTFSLEIQEFGVTEVRELIPNGGNVNVTEDNKLEYIQLVCQLKMSGSIKQQLNAFLAGFYEIIPKRLISIFNEQELELLISGLPNIDIEDLRSNTEYHKYQATSIQIQWFWRALRSFDQAERAKFLQFVTGTSKVPLQGFSALEGMNGTQKFQIHRDDRSTDRLPSAHTCFNQLDLPVYKSYDKLRTNMLKAIHECSEGFGFA